jgi:hypothetical protein
MIAWLIRQEGRWGSPTTAAAIICVVLVGLSLSVVLLGAAATAVLAAILEGCGWLWLDPREPTPLNRSAQQQLAENLQQNAARSSPTMNPRIAVACLILIVLMAGFFVADEYTSCRHEHGPNYKCFPGGRRLVR